MTKWRKSSLGWFRNYLTTRTQRVQFENDMSSTRAIRFGVPQGLILGPLLFVLYINDLPQCLENCSINMYADDTVMYFTNLCTSEIARVVQDDLNRVVQWMESSRLILNQSKTKSMLFGSWQNLAKSPNFCIQLYGKTLETVAKFSYLGVVFDENLSWKDHVEYVGSKVSRRLGLLSRIRSCLTVHFAWPNRRCILRSNKRSRPRFLELAKFIFCLPPEIPHDIVFAVLFHQS